MRMNDRQMKQAMKKMGIKQNTIDGVTEVIIRTNEKEIVIRNADVICVARVRRRSRSRRRTSSSSCPRPDATPRRPSRPWRPRTDNPQRPSSR